MAISALHYQIVADARKFSDGINLTKKGVREARKVMMETRTPAEKYADELDRLSKLHSAGGISGEAFRRGVAKARADLDATTKSTREWGQALKFAAANLGAQAIRDGIMLVKDALIQALKDIEAYNKAFAKSTAIMGGMSDMMEGELKTKSRQVAFQLAVDAREAAEGYEFLAAAGLNAEQSLMAIGPAATFARAGSMEMAAAVDILTDAQMGLGLVSNDNEENMRNMRFVANQLASAYKSSNASIQQFGEAITSGVGPALRLLKKDMEEGLSVLKVWASSGFAKGRDAGTKFTIMLRDLQRAAVNNKKAWEDAGLDLFDDDGDVRNLSDIIEQLTHRFGKLSPEMRIAEFQQLGFTFKSLKATESLIGLHEQMRIAEQQARATGEIIDDIAQKKITAFEKATKRAKAEWQAFTATMLEQPLEDLFTAAEGQMSVFSKGLMLIAANVDVIRFTWLNWKAIIKDWEAAALRSMANVLQSAASLAEKTGGFFGAEIDVAWGEDMAAAASDAEAAWMKAKLEIEDFIKSPLLMEQFQNQVDSMNESLAATGDAVKEAADGMNEVASASKESAREGIQFSESANAQAEQLRDKLQEQVTKYGEVARAAQISALAQEGAGRVVLAQLDALDKKLSQLEVQEKVGGLFANIQADIEKFGKTREELELLEAQRAGADKGQLKAIELLQGLRARKEQQQEDAQRAKEIAEEVKSPLEKAQEAFQERMAELKRLKLPPDVFAKASKAARDELEQAKIEAAGPDTDEGKHQVAAIARGSAEAISLSNRRAFEQNKPEVIQQKQLSELQQIRTAIQQQGRPQVAQLT